MNETRLVVPGTRLCPADDGRFQSGRGTYVLHGYIYSSLAGVLRLRGKGGKEGDEGDVGQLTAEVESGNKEQNVLPQQGDIVTAKVLSVNPR